MKNLRSRVLPVVAVLFLSSAVFGASRPITLKLNLPAKPAFPRPEMTALLTAGPLTLEVTDARSGVDLTVVGAQREKGNDVYLWQTAQPVGSAVQAMAAQVLAGWSVRVASEAELGLKLELTSYYVTEKSEMFGSTYVPEVRMKVTLADRAGGRLWAGEASGTAKSPGVDARASMCNEALSVALRAALGNALSQVTLETAKPTVGHPAAGVVAGTIEGATLFAELQRMKGEGATDEALVAYVEAHRPLSALTVDEILSWKNAGIPDAAIKAATRP